MKRAGAAHKVVDPNDTISEHDALVRASEIVDWMMEHIGRMCPPRDGLYDLNEHSRYVDRERARGNMPPRKPFTDGRPLDQHAPGATPMRRRRV